MLLRVAKEAIGEYLAEAQNSWKVITDNYRSENPPLEPTATLVVIGGSLEFSLSYVTAYTKRTAMRDQLFTKIVEEVANSNGRLEWASPAVAPTRRRLGTRLKRGLPLLPKPRAKWQVPIDALYHGRVGQILARSSASLYNSAPMLDPCEGSRAIF